MKKRKEINDMQWVQYAESAAKLDADAQEEIKQLTSQLAQKNEQTIELQKKLKEMTRQQTQVVQHVLTAIRKTV